MSIDRQADLHYAYQFGQDAARNDYSLIRAEFLSKFAGDDEALAEFDKGYQAQLKKVSAAQPSAENPFKS